MTGRSLARAIAAAAGVDHADVTDLRAVAGGDVSRAATARVRGRRVFVKHLQPPVPGLLASEAAGLRWLAEGLAATDDLRVPEVVGVTEEAADTRTEGMPGVLVLEFVPTRAAAADHDQRLGRGLAALHRAGAESFGATWQGFLGRLPVPNDPDRDWASVLGRRLLATGRDAAEGGHLPSGTAQRLERLVERLPALLGPPEPPARLHGDLWAGNAMIDEGGGPVLVDPAAFGGHREVDLAMMRLFGGFSEATFAAYGESHPLADGHAERVPLLQLHPLLVHAAMFGGGYGRRSREIVDSYL